jgi:alkylation response protein AidB-like acyl-CoA dehydrogenase
VDFSYTDKEEGFRLEVRAWLESSRPNGWVNGRRTDGGAGEDDFEFRRAWDRTLFAAGYTSGIAWPIEYGGRGASVIDQLILYQEMGRAKSPIEMARQGRQLLGPTIIAWGTDAQKAEFLPGILSGERYFCQGFSEPDAGSDLASLRTRAIVDGDTLVVNGQKTWTSEAHRADWIFALVRTDSSGDKHHGISLVLIDMQTPGITAAPFRTCTGNLSFCNVYFDDVTVPVGNVIGTLDDGWRVVGTALSHERATMGLGRYLIHRLEVAELRDLVNACAGLCSEYAVTRAEEALGRCLVDLETLRLTGYWNVSKMLRGEDFGSKGSILKIHYSELTQAIGAAALELLDVGVGADLPELAGIAAQWRQQFLESRAASIYAGTNEIQRNIIAERLIGLPR